MAIKIDGGKRSEIMTFDPNVVVIDWDNNNARPMGLAEHRGAVESMKISILSNGLQTPIGVYVEDDGHVHVVYGFTRAQALLELCREGKVDPSTMPLKAIVVKADSAARSLMQIIENSVRTESSPIDRAHAIAVLRDAHGKPNKEIAEIFNCSEGSVSQLYSLTLLAHSVSVLVHRGLLPYSGALLIANYSHSLQEKIVARAEAIAKDSCKKGEFSGEIPVTILKNVIRDMKDEILQDKAENTGEGDSEGKPKKRGAKRGSKRTDKVKRSASDVVAFIERISGFSEFASLILDYRDGMDPDMAEAKAEALERIMDLGRAVATASTDDVKVRAANAKLVTAVPVG